MSEFNLFDFLALSRTQLVRLRAELLGVVRPGSALQAKVELKLSPGRLPPEQGMPVFQLGVRLACDVFHRDDTEHVLFSAECVMNAIYRQFHGGPLDAELFDKHHAGLGRQLYPLVHQQLAPLLSQFGLTEVKLPFEIIQRPREEPHGPVH